MTSGLFSGILWGLDTLLIGLFLERMGLGSPLIASLISTFLHDFFSSIWMIIYTSIRKQWQPILRALKTSSGRAIVIGSLLGGPVGMSGYVLSIKYLGPSLTAIISSIYPALSVFFSYVFLKEKMSRNRIIGLIICLGSVVLLNLGSDTATGSNHLLGLFFAMLACLGWSLEGVIVSYGMREEEIKDEHALQIRQLSSAIVYAGVIIPLIHGFPIVKGAVLSAASWIIILAALFGTASYLLYYRAIYKIGLSKAVALNITYVAWAVLFSIFFGGTIDVKTVILGAAVVGGSLMAAIEW
ncbi:DMT family transporter [Allofustis seminis]|uniref:DMT family transporter n=1 Tax=Allofustis seminis TaxID=166939 RepID=UPI000373FCC7|nr:DMT family transporter [Allofustis seminis]